MEDIRQTTSPLSLDQVLAMEVPNFGHDMGQLQETLKNFINEPQLRGTSIEVQVIPAAKALQTWLGLFEQSMRRGNRLEGATKSRVCFAERGMVYLVLLIDAVQDQLDILKRDKRSIDTTQRRNLKKCLKKFIEEIVGCGRPKGLTLMRNWLSTLTDIVPLELRSPDTPLSILNMGKLNLLC